MGKRREVHSSHFGTEVDPIIPVPTRTSGKSCRGLGSASARLEATTFRLSLETSWIVEASKHRMGTLESRIEGEGLLQRLDRIPALAQFPVAFGDPDKQIGPLSGVTGPVSAGL